MRRPVTLSINGTEHTVPVEPRALLVHVMFVVLQELMHRDADTIKRVRDAGTWVVPTLLNRSDYVIEKNVQLGLPPVFSVLKYSGVHPHSSRAATAVTTIGTNRGFRDRAG